MKNRMTSRFRRFAKDTDGSYSIETVLMLPMLVWAMLAMFSYFDGLKLANINIKAAHTISDVLSRETDPVDRAYIDGTARLLDFLISRNYDKSLRISVFRYDGEDDEFELVWSDARGSIDGFTDADVARISDRLPITADGDTIITVETWLDYRSAFVMGLTDTTLYNFLVTSPRFAPQLLWAG